MEASQIIVPQKGFFSGNESLIVVNLGSLKVKSLAKAKVTTVKQLITMGKSEEDIIMHLRDNSYDKFALDIVNFQVSYLWFFLFLLFFVKAYKYSFY